MKFVVFWDMTPCGSGKRSDIAEENIACIFRAVRLCEPERLRSLVKLNMQTKCSSEKSLLLTRATRRHIPEDNILNSDNDLQDWNAYGLYPLPGFFL
jgi:hypothetical protein